MFVKEETRHLARIVIIDEVKAIPKADRLEIAVVGGWECIVMKGMYKAGDLGLYFEVDASIPADSAVWGDFDMKRMLIRTDADNQRQYVVIKSIRLRGVLSQGLLLQISHLNYLSADALTPDLDLTSQLEVLKYVSPEEWKLYQAQLREASGMRDRHTKSWWWKLRMWLIKGILVDGLQDWPEGHSKSEEDRVQNLGKQYAKLVEMDDTWEASIKFDGESATVYQDLKDGSPGVAQRNFSLRTEDVAYTRKESFLVYLASWMRFIPRRLRGGACPFPRWLKVYSAEGVPLVRHMKKLGAIQRLQAFNKNQQIPSDLQLSGPHEYLAFARGKTIAVQGEMVGPSFNRNAEGLKENRFYIYRVYGNGTYVFPPEEARAITLFLGLEYIPVIDKNMKLPADIQDLIKLADGEGYFDSKRLREGLVLKNNRTGQSFKVISNKWLERHDKEDLDLLLTQATNKATQPEEATA